MCRRVPSGPQAHSPGTTSCRRLRAGRPAGRCCLWLARRGRAARRSATTVAMAAIAAGTDHAGTALSQVLTFCWALASWSVASPNPRTPVIPAVPSKRRDRAPMMTNRTSGLGVAGELAAERASKVRVGDHDHGRAHPAIAFGSRGCGAPAVPSDVTGTGGQPSRRRSTAHASGLIVTGRLPQLCLRSTGPTATAGD